MDHRNGEELEAPLLESAPLPEKRRSTFLTVCPFILGKGQILWQLFSLLHLLLRVATLHSLSLDNLVQYESSSDRLFSVCIRSQ